MPTKDHGRTAGWVESGQEKTPGNNSPWLPGLGSLCEMASVQAWVQPWGCMDCPE